MKITITEWINKNKSNIIMDGPPNKAFFGPTRVLFLLLIFFRLTACGNEPEDKSTANVSSPESVKQFIQKQKDYTCLSCHDFEPDACHAGMECPDCHRGKSPALSRETAHQDLVAQPAHPGRMAANCGKCHPDQAKAAGASPHFTLAGEVNTVRQAFGANESIASLIDIPVAEFPADTLELVDDMLRRRCLRCHVYWPGNEFYPETRHGTGCAACHLSYQGGELQSHKFVVLPPDRQCLHCHYGNHVGGDYHGFFEHDFHWAYRTPYRKDGLTPDRPYGVENHPLSPDIHQKAGLSCIDCHDGGELMSADPSAKIACRTCHQPKREEIGKRKNLHLEDGNLLLTTRITGKTMPVPRLEHPAHNEYGEKVSCHVCHGKWAYNDVGTHLIRLDLQDYEPWKNLDVQSSFEAEGEITDALYGDGEYTYPFMQDKITGRSTLGLWLKGFELRRWEDPIFCRDGQGILQVCRPILDLHLSWVNEDWEVVVDAVTPTRSPEKGLLPYAPHTIGHAGPFFRQRLRENSLLLEKPHFLPQKTETGKTDNE